MSMSEETALRPNATLQEFVTHWLATRDRRTRHSDAQRLRDHVLSLLGKRRVHEHASKAGSVLHRGS